MDWCRCNIYMHFTLSIWPYIILLEFAKAYFQTNILVKMVIKSLHVQVEEMRQSFFDEVSIFQTNAHIIKRIEDDLHISIRLIYILNYLFL